MGAPSRDILGTVETEIEIVARHLPVVALAIFALGAAIRCLFTRF